MARPAYSTEFAGYSPGDLAAGEPVSVGPVDEGYIWVVRDIIAISPALDLDSYPSSWNGIVFYDGYGIPLWWLIRPWIRQSVTYHWEGRQIIEAGQQLYTLPYDNGWSARISGYILANPG